MKNLILLIVTSILLVLMYIVVIENFSVRMKGSGVRGRYKSIDTSENSRAFNGENI